MELLRRALLKQALLKQALLKQAPQKRVLALSGLAALALLFCAGCMLIDALGGRERGLVFSHRLHVVEEELGCVSCHESAEVEESPGMPAADSCAVCHDGLDSEKPPERRVASLFDAQGFRAARVSLLADEIVFGHHAHVGALGDCAACHRGIDTNEGVDASVALDMAACQSCHAEKGRTDECRTCHLEITEAWAPPSHARDWKKLHGRACRRNDPPASDDCMLCHQESSCEQCHRVEPPQSHDPFFRTRGHAVLSRVDRAACATCHEPALCDRCHAEVQPLSHRNATFGNTLNTHCFTCHFPLEAEGCATCHKTATSHSLGPPKPPWHTPAMDCRSCHGAGLPLSHVDNGSNCNLCHP